MSSPTNYKMHFQFSNNLGVLVKNSKCLFSNVFLKEELAENFLTINSEGICIPKKFCREVILKKSSDFVKKDTKLNLIIPKNEISSKEEHIFVPSEILACNPSREILLKNTIIQQRRFAAEAIQNFIRTKNNFKQELCNSIKKQILQERNSCAVKIQKIYKSYMVKKDIKKIIKMKNENYTIFYYKNTDSCCPIGLEPKTVKILVTQVKSSKIIYFTYNKFLQCFLLFIKKIGSYNRKYLINFIINEKTIVDTNFPTQYNKETGKYFNILDFHQLNSRGYLSNIKSPCDTMSENSYKRVPLKRRSTYPGLNELKFNQEISLMSINPILKKSLENESKSPKRQVNINLLINYF
jgi:hypothetical protein